MPDISKIKSREERLAEKKKIREQILAQTLEYIRQQSDIYSIIEETPVEEPPVEEPPVTE
jgi:hypothetical protein